MTNMRQKVFCVHAPHGGDAKWMQTLGDRKHLNKEPVGLTDTQFKHLFKMIKEMKMKGKKIGNRPRQSPLKEYNVFVFVDQIPYLQQKGSL